MAYKYYNPNPKNKRVGDCTVRALSKATGRRWEDTFIGLCSEAMAHHDMPSSNHVWGSYLHRFGFQKKNLEHDTTVGQFAEEHPEGRFVLATEGHVVTVIDGAVYDTWDSSNEIILYYWEKETPNGL